MPHMKCKDCGNVVFYRNKKGYKAPKICPNCEGELKKAAWYDGEFKIVQPNIKKGKMIVCPLCGRRRKDTGYNVITIKEDTEFKVITGSWIQGNEKQEYIKINAGEKVCWLHSKDSPVIKRR